MLRLRSDSKFDKSSRLFDNWRRDVWLVMLGVAISALVAAVMWMSTVSEKRVAAEMGVYSAKDVKGQYGVLSTGIPSCAHGFQRAKHVFMFMVSHSGTTPLITQLGTHPEVRDFTEDLDAEPLVRCLGDVQCEFMRVQQIFAEADAKDQVGVLKYNAKTVPNNINLWRKFLIDNEARLMFMYRENVFKRAVGRYPYYYLNYTEHFGGLKEGEKNRCETGEACTFEVVPKHLLCEMKRAKVINDRMMNIVSYVSNPSQCFLEIKYEDYLYYPDDTVRMVQDYLNITRTDTRMVREKATSDNMCNVIENYADVCAAFNECRHWSKFINDERNGCVCSNFTYTSLGDDTTNPMCKFEKLPSELPYCMSEKEEPDVEPLEIPLVSPDGVPRVPNGPVGPAAPQGPAAPAAPQSPAAPAAPQGPAAPAAPQGPTAPAAPQAPAAPAAPQAPAAPAAPQAPASPQAPAAPAAPQAPAALQVGGP